jgi:hypothetical protein
MQTNQPQGRSPRRYLGDRARRRNPVRGRIDGKAARADGEGRRAMESAPSPEELERELTPSPGQGRAERAARERRDREELGRPGVEERERALQEDVVERREREATENE